MVISGQEVIDRNSPFDALIVETLLLCVNIKVTIRCANALVE
jgi:hypothetical protein